MLNDIGDPHTGRTYLRRKVFPVQRHSMIKSLLGRFAVSLIRQIKPSVILYGVKPNQRLTVKTRRTFCLSDKTSLTTFRTNTQKRQFHLSSSQNSEDTMADNRYIIGYAKLGTSGCKKCKQKIDKGGLRIGKVVSNPFSDEGGDMKQWYHPPCIFETFKRARATTKKIEEPDDMEGFQDIDQEDKDIVLKLIKESASNSKSPGKKPAASTPKVQAKIPFSPPKKTVKAESADDEIAGPSTSKAVTGSSSSTDDDFEKDDGFREFRRLCANIADESSYLSKTNLVQKYLTKGTSGDGFKGDLYIWVKLLLPGVMKRIYNINNKQLVKLFSQIFGTSLSDMVADLDQGDVAETVRIFYEQSKVLPPQKKSSLSVQQVDSLLEDLSRETKEDDQQRILKKIAKRCTGNDLKMVVRLIKHDLRINAGAKHILDGLDPNAYAAFQASRDLKDVVERVVQNKDEAGGKPGMSKKLSVRASLMTPVLPMLAEACRSVDHAMKKCPNGFYAEIKYDGERVQVHKKGNSFQYFSRSLKPVLPHKVNHFKEFIPKAFPSGDDLILDAEVLLIDTKTDKPLPFGSLGVHKKAQFEDAKVGLFIFDCLHINGENLMDKPVKTRRKILSDNMTEIPHRVLFSEIQHITDPDDLQELMNKVFREGLEGLVLKDVNGIYEPGKRHWLKIKKDYLEQGTMADSADLSVLGAYFGSGNKGGIMSIFLLGVYNPVTEQWCTVTKCHSGLDDKTLDQLQNDLDMIKISKDASKVPKWLNVKKQMVPDFIVTDPKKSPVWEIAGAEFSKAEVHTADGISIRFPRIAKFRDDKSWKEATDLPRLKQLFKSSKETTDLFPSKKRKSPKAKTTPVKKKSDEDGSDTDVDSDVNNHSDISNGKESSNIKKYFSPVKTPTKKSSSQSETPVKTGVKRPADDSEESSPSKKSKPMCKYGSNCYQTNPGHLAKFDHTSAGSKEALPSPGKKLPNVFTGMKIYLGEGLKDYKQLKRYIIAFDGDLASDIEIKSADVVVLGPDQSGDDVKTKGTIVESSWLWECIKKKTIVPFNKK